MAGPPAATDEYEYAEYEEDLGDIGYMFGSLMAVAKQGQEGTVELEENWWKIIREWYPHMHCQVYCVPPVHFNSVSYIPRVSKFGPKNANDYYGIREYSPSQYSKIKDDEAQQRILWTIVTFLQNRRSTAFVLSNMEFQNYLNKDYSVPKGSAVPEYPRPNIRKNEEGDVDVLIIDKREGVFLLEVKAIGDSDEVRAVSEDDKLKELRDKFIKVTKQIGKQKAVVQKLLQVLDPGQNIKVRTGLALVNTPRDLLKKALRVYPDSAQDLMKALAVTSVEKVSASTFCSDDLPPMWTCDASTMSEELRTRVDEVWSSLKEIAGESQAMSDDLYEHIVALFCGPLTTVKICTDRSMPRVRLHKIVGKRNRKEDKFTVIPHEVRTMAGAAREVARRFSELVLQQAQIEILQKNEDFVHLQGPPGTGKTLLLMLRILVWLDEGHKVWIISFFPPSRSVTHVLFEQVKRMLDAFHTHSEAEKRKQHLHIFIQTRPEETLDSKYYERMLHKFRERARHVKPNYRVTNCRRRRLPTAPPKPSPHDRKVCLAVDESGMSGKGLDDFFSQVSICHRRKDFRGEEFNAGLSVWSASMERCGRPRYTATPGKKSEKKFGVCWKLLMPLRCPPTVQRALMLVQPWLDGKNVCFFKKDLTLAHPAYPKRLEEVKNPREEGPTGPHNQYPAEGLKVHLIAHGNHEKAEEDIWYCKQCGDELAKYLKNDLKIGSGERVASDVALQCRDVLIVGTQKAFQFAMPAASFLVALKKHGFKVAVNTTREEGKMALTDDDVILVADITSVHGIERAVIIAVPEVREPKTIDTTYRTFCQSADNDCQLKEAIEASAGKDFTISAAGEYQRGDDDDDDGQEGTGDGDSEGREEGGGVGAARDKPQEADGAAGLTAAEGDEPPDRQTEDGDDRDEDDDDSQSASESEDDEERDPLTYADAHSERHIKAALASLSPQSRKDIFYIGSRTVCQLILLHLAKDPPHGGPGHTAGHPDTPGHPDTSGHSETSGHTEMSGNTESSRHTEHTESSGHPETYQNMDLS